MPARHEVLNLIPNTTETNKKNIQKLSLVPLFTSPFYLFWGGHPENRAVFKFNFQTHTTMLEVLQALGMIVRDQGRPHTVLGSSLGSSMRREKAAGFAFENEKSIPLQVKSKL